VVNKVPSFSLICDECDIFAACPSPAETWFEENDPEGVAFEYEVLE